MNASMFLNHEEPRNSKSFYYTRLCIFHKIPYMVENEYFVKDVQLLSNILNPEHPDCPVMSVTKKLTPSDIWNYAMTDNRIIADNKKVREIFESTFNFNDLNSFWLDDDYIRNTILTDLALGRDYYSDVLVPDGVSEFEL